MDPLGVICLNKEKTREALLAGEKSIRLIIFAMILACIISMLCAIAFGSVSIDIGQIWKILLFKTTNFKTGHWSVSQEQIVWMIRVPRILFTALVGGGLAVIGAVMQATVRNRMADPYILGLSSGASTGAALAILTGAFNVFGIWATSLAAFLGSLCSISLVFLFSRSGGRMTARKLILSGVAVSYLFSAITSFLTYLAPDDGLREVTLWLLGSTAAGKWDNLLLPAIVVPAGSIYLLFQARNLDAISMGEETATSLGVDGARFRKKIFLVISLMTGVVTALCGAIGFVGLMAPHMVRIVFGNNHRRLLLLCMFFGAIFLLWADVIARVILAPMELPIGIITAIIGAPFFIWLLQSKG